MAQLDLSIIIPIAILAGLGFAGILTRGILRQDAGSERMREIAAAIQQGAQAFLRRQYKAIGIIAALLAVVFAAAIFGQSAVSGKSDAVALGLKTAGAFALGATFSALSGFIGMQVAIRTNVRSAAGSTRSFNDALVIALRGGAVSGLSIVALSLAGVSILYYGYGYGVPPAEHDQRNLILSIVGFGFGASLVARSFGVLASIVGVYVVRAREDEAPMGALNRGYLVTTLLAAVLFGFAAWAMLEPAGADVDPSVPGVQLASSETWLFYWLCGIAGMVTAFLYVWITQYYTEARYRPVKEIARASETGPATNIISGFSVGLEATWLPVLVVVSALLISYWLGQSTGIPRGGLYGTAIATMGMLSTAAYILAMDTFGPIVDNGAGIIEMSGMSEGARRNMDKLDAAGNTTKALKKGYGVGSAASAAFHMFNAFLEDAHVTAVDLAHPETFVGGFIGAALVFLFTAYAIRAVGRAAWAIIKDVRDQFHEDPGIMAGTSKPDYARSVDIVTRSALKEMLVPGLLAVATPVAVGLFFGSVRLTPGLLSC